MATCSCNNTSSCSSGNCGCNSGLLNNSNALPLCLIALLGLSDNSAFAYNNDIVPLLLLAYLFRSRNNGCPNCNNAG